MAILGMLNFQFVRYFNGLDICSPIQFDYFDYEGIMYIRMLTYIRRQRLTDYS